MKRSRHRPPTLMIRTDMAQPGRVICTTPASDYPSETVPVSGDWTMSHKHEYAAAAYLDGLSVNHNGLLRGTGPGNGSFMYHFTKVMS